MKDMLTLGVLVAVGWFVFRKQSLVGSDVPFGPDNKPTDPTTLIGAMPGIGGVFGPIGAGSPDTMPDKGTTRATTIVVDHIPPVNTLLL